MFSQASFLVIVGYLVRPLLMMAAGWLAGHKLLAEGTGGVWVDTTFLVAVTYLWSLIERWQQKKKQDILIATAITGPATATIADVHETVAAGFGAKIGDKA